MHAQTNLVQPRWSATYAIAIISFAQLFGTSLWFSANSAAMDLMREWQISVTDLGWLTNAVQAGFIFGTFFIALTGIADRFKASSIFVCAALSGGVFNLCFAWLAQGLSDGLIYRFLLGLCLAGIYPIGMKLVVQWAPHKAGQVLAQLVAMLTLGTALPFALTALSADLAWQTVITFSSLLAVCAAALIFYLGVPKTSVTTQSHQARKENYSSPTAATPRSSTFQVFKIPKFRAAALGYFGHMWELYAFWTLLPLFIARSGIIENLALPSIAPAQSTSAPIWGFQSPVQQIALLSFAVMACGALGCLLGGYLSRRFGSDRVALTALLISGLCGLSFALGWAVLPAWLLVLILALWGASVIADSPQFSALSAQACPPEQIGAALAIQNSIGFAITIVSIALTSYMFDLFGLNAAWVLLIGPIFGIAGYTATRLAPDSSCKEKIEDPTC